jgi:sugar phosphate isomerase/epimerase
MGYAGVEFADYFGRSAGELRRLLDDTGLQSCGTHIYMRNLRHDELQRTIDFTLETGTRYLIVRWLDDSYTNSLSTLKQTAYRFTKTAETLKPYGLRFGYHSNRFDFQTIGKKTKWETFAEYTGNDVVLQLDTGNAAYAGGENVASLLKRYPGRTSTIHLKPFSATNDKALLGEDDLDWSEIIDICQSTAGTEWFIIAYEKEGIPALPAMQNNLENLRRMTGQV